jgi:hypothetical protein
MWKCLAQSFGGYYPVVIILACIIAFSQKWRSPQNAGSASQNASLGNTSGNSGTTQSIFSWLGRRHPFGANANNSAANTAIPPTVANPSTPGTPGDVTGVWTSELLNKRVGLGDRNVEFRQNGEFVDFTDRRNLKTDYTYDGKQLSIYYTNPRGATSLMESGTVDWAGANTFTLTITSNADSIRREGWKYVFRRR